MVIVHMTGHYEYLLIISLIYKWIVYMIHIPFIWQYSLFLSKFKITVIFKLRGYKIEAISYGLDTFQFAS